MRKFHNRKMLAAATIMSCMMASQVIAAPAYNQSGKSNQITPSMDHSQLKESISQYRLLCMMNR